VQKEKKIKMLPCSLLIHGTSKDLSLLKKKEKDLLDDWRVSLSQHPPMMSGGTRWEQLFAESHHQQHFSFL